MGGRVKEKIERSYLYTGRLCRACLDIFYEPPEQSYAPPHKMEDSDGQFTEWCTGSYQDWRPYSYGRVITPAGVDNRKRPDRHKKRE